MFTTLLKQRGHLLCNIFYVIEPLFCCFFGSDENRKKVILWRPTCWHQDTIALFSMREIPMVVPQTKYLRSRTYQRLRHLLRILLRRRHRPQSGFCEWVPYQKLAKIRVVVYCPSLWQSGLRKRRKRPLRRPAAAPTQTSSAQSPRSRPNSAMN